MRSIKSNADIQTRVQGIMLRIENLSKCLKKIHKKLVKYKYTINKSNE